MDVRGEAPDEEVVARVLDGDVEAFGLLIRRYEAGLGRFATRMLGSRDAAAGGRSAGYGGRVGACRAPGPRTTGAGDAVAREARGVRTQARGGAELPGDGRRDRRAHPDPQDARAPRPRGVVAGPGGGRRMNPIDPRIHQALDGEIGRDALPPEARRAVERLEAAAALLAAAAPADLASRV